MYILYNADAERRPGTEYILGVYSSQDNAIRAAINDADNFGTPLSDKDVKQLRKHGIIFRGPGEGSGKFDVFGTSEAVWG